MRRRQAGNSRDDSPARREPAGIPALRPTEEPPGITKRWPLAALAALTCPLSLPIFEPRAVWPLAYGFFVPWLVAACLARRAGWFYLISVLVGAAVFLSHWGWLYSTTPEGYILGGLVLAMYLPLAGWLLRHLCRDRRVSIALAFPVIWTTMELIRSYGPLAFPWFLLGHTQIRVPLVIQIADFAGVYGVTFVVAMVNGWLADLFARPVLAGPRITGWTRRASPAGTVALALVLVGTLVYGRVRLGHEPFEPGPRVSVVQDDFLLSPEAIDEGPTDFDKERAYLALLEQAAGDKPDMLVLPETPWSLYLNRELRELASSPVLAKIEAKREQMLLRLSQYARDQYDDLARRAREYGATIVVGGVSIEPQPDGHHPIEHRYNSTFVFQPSGEEAGRYDKVFLVLFGEYVPFRYNRWLKPLYYWLNSITPWGRGGYEYSLTPGTEFTTFTMQERSAPEGERRRFGVTICYEDTIPQIFRRFVSDGDGGKRVDFMLNVSNDGWFGHGAQQAQHLATCAFRAVENRVSVARSVNTGVSGFISSDGAWYKLVGASRTEPVAGGSGYQTGRLMIDPRVTFYSRHGDVAALCCAALTLLAAVDAVGAGLRRRRERIRDRKATI